MTEFEQLVSSIFMDYAYHDIPERMDYDSAVVNLAELYKGNWMEDVHEIVSPADLMTAWNRELNLYLLRNRCLFRRKFSR